MVKFITLTDIDADSQDRRIFINAMHIESFYLHITPEGIKSTFVATSQDTFHEVTETPTEIYELIVNLYKS